VGGNVDLLRPRLEERLAELTPLSPRIEEGELGKDAIVLGAIATALEAARESRSSSGRGVAFWPRRSATPSASHRCPFAATCTIEASTSHSTGARSSV
jgi:hypothetical protein